MEQPLTIKEWMAFAVFALTFIGSMLGVVNWIHGRLDMLRHRLDQLTHIVEENRKEVAVIQKEIESSPEWNEIHQRFECLENKLEKKMDAILNEIKRLSEQTTSEFMRCPAHRNGGPK